MCKLLYTPTQIHKHTQCACAQTYVHRNILRYMGAHTHIHIHTHMWYTYTHVHTDYIYTCISLTYIQKHTCFSSVFAMFMLYMPLSQPSSSIVSKSLFTESVCLYCLVFGWRPHHNWMFENATRRTCVYTEWVKNSSDKMRQLRVYVTLFFPYFSHPYFNKEMEAHIGQYISQATEMQTLCWSKTRPSFSGAHNSYIYFFVPRIGMYIRISIPWTDLMYLNNWCNIRRDILFDSPCIASDAKHN